MIRAAVMAVLLAALPLFATAQTVENDSETMAPDDGFTMTPELDLENAGDDGSFDPIQEVEENKAVEAPGAVLRGLDKVTGEVADLPIVVGQTLAFGRLQVTLGECRYPAGNPAGDAYGFLVIRAADVDRPVFQGWMIASSPALNALDHPRFDIWLLRCTTE
jgi:hypothetical protein